MRQHKSTNPAVSAAVPHPDETLGELVNQLVALESEMVAGAANALGHRRRWQRSVRNYRAELARRMASQGISCVCTASTEPWIATLADADVTVERFAQAAAS